MLHTAVVPVHGHPVFELVHIGKRLVVVGIAIAEEIPGTSRPLGHCICLSLRRASALGACAVDKFRDLGKRGLSVLAGLKVLDLGESERKLFIRHAYNAALRAVDQRDRLSPVSLTVESPVLHLELHACVSDALLFKDSDHLSDGILLVGKAVEVIGVYHLSVACISFLGDIAALDYFNDRDVKSVREIPVSLVVRGNCHDRARAVSHHYIVGDEDRDLLAVDGVDRLESLDLKTGLILDQLRSLKLGLLGALVSVSVDGVHIGNAVLILVDHRMLGSHDHESHAEKRIGTGRIDLKFLIDAVDCEIHKSAGGFADPVNLLLLDSLGILHCVKAFQELVGVFGDLKIPDILGKLDDVGMADVALAALAVLV